MNDKFEQLVELAGGDPIKKDYYEKMGIVEYYILLNKKMEDTKKELKARAKK